MSKTMPHTGQGVLAPPVDPAEKMHSTGGVVRLEDLEWPIFDPEHITTMAEYAGAIGLRMAETPRENSVTDQSLQLYRNDFKQAEPGNLARGLYFPLNDWRSRPKKSVVRVSQQDYHRSNLHYPGRLPFTTGVAVSEDVYTEVVKNAPFYASQIDNNTQRVHTDDPIVEARADLAGESVVYAFVNKHEILEERNQKLIGERALLAAVYKSVSQPSYYRPVRSLEPFRVGAQEAIQEMVRIACKGLNYGTNQTRATANAVASNLYRSTNTTKWWAAYTKMALEYNDAVRGKVNQSIESCLGEIAFHREHLINNLDREYEDE